MELRDREVPGPKRDFVGYGRRQPRVVWPDGAKVALNIVVNYEEGSEYSLPAGDGRNEGWAEIAPAIGNETRDLMTESVYEYGSRAGIWRLMRLFDDCNVKVTFFAAAVALERNPEVGQWLQEAGHEPCSHGWRWVEPWKLSRDEERQQIHAAIESIKKTCGERPLGWYCRYGPSVNTRELLVEEGGFVYDADAYNDDLPYFTEVHGKRHLIVPYNALPYNDVRFVLSQGYSSPSDFADYCIGSLEELRREGEAGYPKVMSVGLHPRWIGQPGRIIALRRFIEHALEKGDVWITRRIDIARWWLDHYREFGAEDTTAALAGGHRAKG
jgi:peptidoglycan/xylan/chitin deacetylase (PgdA/CDA1 family)